MYFSGIYKTIRSLEEKKFYDVALLFLSAKGYQNLAIIDGSGDGGRDVTCSWDHLRIQLSVRSDWAAKINEEAKLAITKGAKHFIYITNRRITDQDRESFLQERYAFKGLIELTVFDLASLSTTLALPGVVNSAREVLGIEISGRIKASPKEIAISSTLLFSTEARELRDHVVENSVRANVFFHDGISESELLHRVVTDFGNASSSMQATKALHRLCSKGEVIVRDGNHYLAEPVRARMAAANDDFVQSKLIDSNSLQKKYGLSPESSDRLINIALEILARKGNFEGHEFHAVDLASFVAEHSLQRKKISLYDDLSKLTCAKIAQFGEAISHVFSTDTFDILRALGRSKSVSAILDSSVAMPMLFGLSFSHVKSRYGVGAAALSSMCLSHGITLEVPRPYLNEMAHHGLKALDYMEYYKVIGDESRSVLRSSRNAYISHYGHIRDEKSKTDEIGLSEFLRYFGIFPGARPRSIEARIEGILDGLNIAVVSTPKWTPEVRRIVGELKQNEPPYIVDHDASVLTLLQESSDTGYLFATWDKAMTSLVENRSRVYSDTPSRIVDFLSMAQGAAYESEQTVSLLDALIYCDERKSETLARKIESINSLELAYELQKFTDDARKNSMPNSTSEDIVEEFFSQHIN